MPSSPQRPMTICTPPTTMRRPSFFRKRSNSLPAHRLVNIPAEEAGLIFSAGERAAARRRRPHSEASPSPSARLYEAGNVFPSPLTSNPPNFSSVSLPIPTTPSFSSVSLSIPTTPSRTVRPSPLVFEMLVEDSESRPTSAASPDSAMDSISTPSSVDMMPVDPMSPKRVVPNFDLKAYADSLFRFTHGVLEATIPVAVENPGLLVPRLDVYEPSPPVTPGFAETIRFQRPQLQSRFSDWSMTTADVESRSQSQWASALQTPEESVLMSPDSFFAEITPRVANFSRSDVDEVMGSPDGHVSRADSPTRGPPTSTVHMDFFARFTQQSPPARPSTQVEPNSYFFGFDGCTSIATSDNTAESPWPLKPTLEDVLRSPSTPASLLQPSTPAWQAQDGWLNAPQLASSASDSTPYHERNMHMPDPSFRPPSWIIHAIG